MDQFNWLNEDSPDDEEDVYIEIFANCESELMEQLEDLDVSDLKALLASVNRVYQHKAYGSPLYGQKALAKATLTVDDFKRAQEMLIKVNVPEPYYYTSAVTYLNLNSGTVDYSNMAYSISNPLYVSSLDCCAQQTAIPCAKQPQVATAKCNPNSNKETTPMYTDRNCVTETQAKANFLVNELDSTYHDYDSKLYDKYNMLETRPKNAKQAREWIAGGGFTIIGDDDAKYYTSVWSDPTKPRDQKGFAVAQDALSKSYTDTVRVIKIADPTAGLEALKAFETTNLVAN